MLRHAIRTACLAVLLTTPVMLTTAACGKSVGNVIDDATITGRVKTALLNDAEVAGLKINVDTFKSIVTLSGSVRSQTEATRAMDIARRTNGVADVRSTLQITPPE